MLEGPDGCYLKVTADGDVTIGDNYDENAHVEADHRAIKEALEREEREEEPAAASPENQVCSWPQASHLDVHARRSCST